MLDYWMQAVGYCLVESEKHERCPEKEHADTYGTSVVTTTKQLSGLIRGFGGIVLEKRSQ